MVRSRLFRQDNKENKLIATIISNQQIQFTNITPWEEEILIERLTVIDPNARYIDGYIPKIRYNKHYKTIARPLLAELRLLAKEKDLALIIQDGRPPAQYQPIPQDQITPDFLPGITLKDFQLEAIKTIYTTEVGVFGIAVSGGKCVAGESKIILNGHEIRIDSLFHDLSDEEIKDVSGFGLYVDSPDGPVRITKLYKSAPRETCEIRTVNGRKLRGVPEHRVFTDGGWKCLSEVSIGSRVQVYSSGGTSIINRRNNNQTEKTKDWPGAATTNEAVPVYQLFVRCVPNTIRAGAANIFSDDGTLWDSNLPELFSIEGQCREDGQTPRLIRSTSEEMQFGVDRTQSSMGQGKGGQGGANQDTPIRKCGSEVVTRATYKSGGQGTTNKDQKWQCTELGTSIGEISADNGCQNATGDIGNKRTETDNMAQESCDSRFDKRVVLSGQDDQNTILNYEIWQNNLSEPLRTAIHQIVRTIEASLESTSWSDNQIRKFMVLIGLPTGNGSAANKDNRNQIGLYLCDERGRDITEEIGCGNICHQEFNAVFVDHLQKTATNGALHTTSWDTVIAKSERADARCYDLQVDSYSHSYWTNGILSHNSELIAGICKAIPCPTVIISEQIIVIDQLRQRLQLRDVCEEPGLFYAGKMPSGQMIIIGSIQSTVLPGSVPDKPELSNFNDSKSSSAAKKYQIATKRYNASIKGYNSRMRKAKALHKLIAKCEMIIIDESDLASSKQYRNLFRYWFKGRRRYGMTGTPYDELKPVQRLILQEHLGSVIYKQTHEQVAAAGLSVPIEYNMVVFGDDNRTDSSAYDIAVNELMIYNEEFHLTIKEICDQHPNEGTLILVDRDDLGNALQSIIPNSGYVHGATAKKLRPQILSAFERRETKVLIGGKNVRRGMDLRGGCENLIIATGGKLISELDQRIGRARRLNEQGKARIYDFFFICNKYLYAHSRNRLKAIVEMGCKTQVIFRDGTVDGAQFVRSRFRRSKNIR